MANNEIKTNAEIYREQRKERLAKAAKKKGSGKHDKLIRIIVKVISVILIVALVLFGAAKVLTDVFCVPQKVLSAATYGDLKLSVAEYNYYYMSLYNQAVQLSQQYDQQYSGMGSQYFNTAVSPADQEYTGEDAGENVETWADYFKYSAHERGFLTKIVYNEATSEEAKKAGFELTKEQQEEMDTQIKETIDTLAEYAKQNDYALDNFIAKSCGEGLTEKSYTELLERDMMAQYYLTWYQENAAEKADDKAINDYYKENRDIIDLASIRYFTVSYAEAEEGSKDETYTKAQAKARAEQFKSEVTNEKSFIAASQKYAPESYTENYEKENATLVENINASSLDSISEDMSKWVMDSKRAKGDLAIFDAESQECYYIVYMAATAHKNTASAGADVRHLLVEAQTTTEDAEGNAVELSQDKIDANFAKAKDEADKLLKKWKDADATEESFIQLVKENTDDTASAETGGLYEDVSIGSGYVAEFEEWAVAPHKKGDTGIVKTDYGYHIMYFVGADDTQKWESDIRDAIGANAYTEYSEELYNEIHKDAKLSEAIVNFFSARIEKLINRNVQSYAASAQSNAAATY